MASRKRGIRINERILSWRKAAGRRRAAMRKWDWPAMLKVAAVLCLLVAGGASLRYAEGFVQAAYGGEEGSLILVDVPSWANWDLKVRIAEIAGGSRFPIADETARVVSRNLAAMAWLDDVHVQVTHDAVRVKARWRKPLALIHKGSSRFYMDGDLVVLDYIPMPQLPIVEITSLAVEPTPRPGERFDRDDVAAAVTLIAKLHRVDAQFSPKTPLLEQIASIDVSNYKGRRLSREPHITLRTKDDIQIIWGAEIGEWAKHLEATDEEKFAKLYTYHMTHGSLSAGVKYIDLRDPQDRIPQPIDKYR